MTDTMAEAPPMASGAEGIRASDLAPLRPYWHPVALETDLGSDPLAVTVLGERVVVLRSQGTVRAFKDLCLHRGAQISMGKVNADGDIVCPYHGFRYDGDGRCTFIPHQPKDRQRIPARLRLMKHRAQIRYGLVWVALEEPVAELADFPEFDDPAYRVFFGFKTQWDTSAARNMENAMDMTHFPFVHEGSLGDPEHPEAPELDVERDERGIHYEFDWQLPSSGKHLGNVVHYDYNITFPFTSRLRIHGDQGWSVIFSVTLPKTASTMEKWTFFARDHSFDVPDHTFRKFSWDVFEEDRVIVESQRPEMLPVDLTKEIHLRSGDKPGLAYRAFLEEIGVDYA